MILVVKRTVLLKPLLMSLILGSFLYLSGCGKAKFHHFQGDTMGTSYHISAQVPASVDLEKLQQTIDEKLLQINQSMSTYIETSEISRFNRLPINQPFPVSDDFLHVFTIAENVYLASSKAFDPTVSALVDLWGFGGNSPPEGISAPPSQDDIDKAKESIGFNKIERQGNSLIKKANVKLDFSGVAKGYGVDVLAQVMQDHNINNFLIEIGGEMRTAGISPRAGAWRIAITAPEVLKDQISRLDLQNASLATSGDYRNFFDHNGVRYSHTINPTDGYPIKHRLSSVSVIADNTATADAWATALLVLGEEKGFTLAEKQNLAIYMIYNDGKTFKLKYTASMEEYFPKSK